MRRSGLLGALCAAVLVAGLSAGAQAQAPDATPAPADQGVGAPAVDRNRYSLIAVDGEYLRLDRSTGAVAFCRRVNALWRCMPAPDAEAAYQAEIERLTQEIERLTQEIERLAARVEDLEGQRTEPAPPMPSQREVPDAAESELSQKDEQQLDEILDFTEKAMRRFFGLMKDLQQGFEGEGAR
ncbi:hypothetical protein [Polymorphum gilvum]|uniref:Uncharacterized protein n=1 Tax=Polymorphum gilvum (strain LMG 25793 / CGMCC 1.9160 / SL003B-26A1) TaxID=991905 RepID=F2IXM6_POLGS|nr:hypothetical protein [Polymorphum gilvum]ADZ71649.1 hypothetical protein SL003B_3227 [Polymorphum gilvum SL003B-26A1]